MGHLHARVTFDGPAGTLSGILHVPDGVPRGSVLIAHCFTCSKSLKVTRHLATQIEDGGFAVLRFDFTGLGESEGDFAETSVTTNVADIEAAAGYLTSRVRGPLVLVGHSLGGAATLLAAGGAPAARAVVTVAAPSGPEHLQHLFADRDVEEVFREGRATVRIAGRPFEISRDFFDDLQRHGTPERIATLGVPLLVVHGTADRTVDITEGERIFEAASQPRWFAAIPDADHMFVRPGAIDRVGGVIRTFLDTFLGSDS